jgi:CspA family cold shock protein
MPGETRPVPLARPAALPHLSRVDPFAFGVTSALRRERRFVSSDPIVVRCAVLAMRRFATYWEFLLMATGTVKWFNAQKGYGFIKPNNGGNDVFVHVSAVERAGLDGLQEGQTLNYELEQGQRGRVSAVNLRPA